MYNRPRLIPCLLLSNHDLVKTIKFQKPRYLGDPINAVKIFNEKMADEICILDIEASANGRCPDFTYLKDIAGEAFMPLSYGGGISSIEQIQTLFYMGYEKVVINTGFVRDPKLVSQAASLAGSQSIVVAIDVKPDIFGRPVCYIEDGGRRVNSSPIQLALQAEQAGAGELLINDISRDGMMNGYNIELIREISDSVRIPVIACGGAGSIRDIKEVLEKGHAHAAAAGSLFVFYGDEKAVLINMPSEDELIREGVYPPN